MVNMGTNATGYGFNYMENIKSHSSQLFNERIAILFYLLDMDSVGLKQDNNNVQLIKKVFAFVQQIYNNMRTVMRNDPVMRNTLGLNTKDDGIYITDVMKSRIDRMIYTCDQEGYTKKRCYIIVHEIEDLELQIRDVLQYYQYFVRSNFRQKPDISIAAEKYANMVDKMTLDQLKDVVGKKNKIDFENLSVTTDDSQSLEDIDANDDNDDL